MSEVDLAVLFVAAVATAAMTSVVGAGGGMILLIVIVQFVDPLVAVPAHGVIQLFSNGTRAVTLRNNIDRGLLVPFVVPLIPFTVVGYIIADAIPRSSGRAVIGCFALLAVWWPAMTSWLAPRPGRGSQFAVVGAVSGFVNPTVGAAGPLLAPAFRTATDSHVAFVATFAVGQLLSHIVKVGVFAVAGFVWADSIGLIVVGAVGVVIGTRVGSRWLERFDPAALTRLFTAVVTVGAVRLIVGWWV